MEEDIRPSALQVPQDLTIVGVGGCGKNLAYEVCKHEWILKHYLSESGRHLRIYIIDTDENERRDDERRKEDVRRKVEEFQRDEEFVAGSVEIEVFHLPRLANISYVSDLASADVARKIKERKAEPSAEVWWINDPENGIEFADLERIDPRVNEDFGGGVHRRRAISKAIFYKVLSEGEAAGFPSFAGRGTIAIIVGLGGGTGSGMFIDLARYIRSRRGREAEIWLFAVLPTKREGEKEKLNAAVALTELEYVNVGEGLFNYIVLISLEPTGYTRGEDAARREVMEFDAVFPYILINAFYLRRRDIDISDARKPYSYFIFADAHVIEYPIEKLKALRKDYEAIVNELEGITANRKELNDAFYEFFTAVGLDAEGVPTREDYDFLRKEIGIVKNVWENDVGKMLNYETIRAIEYYIENNMPSELEFEQIKRYNDLIDFASKLKNFEQVVGEAELKDETDRKLKRLLPESLECLEDTAKIMKRISGIEHETIRAILKELLKGKKDMGRQIGELTGEKREIAERIKELDGRIRNKNEELKQLERLKERGEKIARDKLDDISADIENIVSIRRKIREAKAEERSLKDSIESMISKCKSGGVKGNEQSWLKSSVTEIQAKVEEISEKIGENLEGLITLIRNISLYYFYEKRLEGLKKRGIGEKIVGFLTGKNIEKERRNYEMKKRDKEHLVREGARRWGFSVQSPFEIRISDDFLTRSLENRLEEIKSDVIRSILRDFYEEGILFVTEEEARERINEILELTDRAEIRGRLREFLLSLYLSKEKYEVKKEEISREIKELEREKEREERILSILDKIEEILERTINCRKELNEHYEKYNERISKILSIGEQERSKIAEEGLYKTVFSGINPRVLSLLTSEKADMSVLEADEAGRRELEKLINQVRRIYMKMMDSYKLGIHNLFIPLETERWNFRKAGLVISSASTYITRKLATGENEEAILHEINKMLQLEKRDDARLVVHNYAKPWDIALVFFAATSFLDNISPLTAGGGYWEVYEKERDNILHHTLLMHEGKYIVRDKLLNLKDAAELANREKGKGANREKGGEDVRSEILKIYTVNELSNAFKKE